MEPKFAYTQHQCPRGSRPDADVDGKLYLIKKVTEMRLTYQVKMLTYSAQRSGKVCVIRLPQRAVLNESLKEFVQNSNGLLKIERA